MNFIRKLKRKYCKSHSHKWLYSFTCLNNVMQIRVCSRCHVVERYEHIMGDKYVWTALVERTNKGAKDFLAKNNIKE